mmetsp:Transcript_46650/g.100514  ORF Transcript_46650/g.100514 Transcript_46650/m.100514 type:complete len:394 (+) Transcript_46650:1151-2332(+)
MAFLPELLRHHQLAAALHPLHGPLHLLLLQLLLHQRWRDGSDPRGALDYWLGWPGHCSHPGPLPEDSLDWEPRAVAPEVPLPDGVPRQRLREAGHRSLLPRLRAPQSLRRHHLRECLLHGQIFRSSSHDCSWRRRGDAHLRHFRLRYFAGLAGSRRFRRLQLGRPSLPRVHALARRGGGSEEGKGASAARGSGKRGPCGQRRPQNLQWDRLRRAGHQLRRGARPDLWLAGSEWGRQDHDLQDDVWRASAKCRHHHRWRQGRAAPAKRSLEAHRVLSSVQCASGSAHSSRTLRPLRSRERIDRQGPGVGYPREDSHLRPGALSAHTGFSTQRWQHAEALLRHRHGRRAPHRLLGRAFGGHGPRRAPLHVGRDPGHRLEASGQRGRPHHTLHGGS